MGINQEEQLAWGMLTLDEGGDKRSSSQSAVTTRQQISLIGKVDMGHA